LNDGVWHNLKHFDVGAEDTFDGLIQAQGPRQLHALVGGETSLRWVEQ
jgi:hypothetical protein